MYRNATAHHLTQPHTSTRPDQHDERPTLGPPIVRDEEVTRRGTRGRRLRGDRGDEHGKAFAPIWRATPKIVFSNTLEKGDWNTQVIGGDIAAAVRELKAQPGRDLLLTGGSVLAAAQTEHRLIDEYHVAVHPVVLGGGRPLFARGIDRIPLRLVSTRGCDGLTAAQHYERG